MKNAKWIWENTENHPDEYVKFYDTFDYAGGEAEIALSCDGNYELYLNGAFLASGQYADYPYAKVYDTVSLTQYCRPGRNELLLLSWHMGVDTSCYINGQPGLLYEVTSEGRVLTQSNEHTLCKRTEDYVCGRCKWITGQMGLSYKYDARKYDGFQSADYDTAGMKNAMLAPKTPEELLPRPNRKYGILPRAEAVLCDETRRIYDLGRETVGYLDLCIRAEAGAEITVAWGEHLADGEVRRVIHKRDFSAELVADGSFFPFVNRMRRLGCRYLQVFCDKPFEVKYIGLDPVEYPLTVLPFAAGNPLRQKIYDTSVRTLRLCMFEHYEDCPWREQSLYTLDSRNQMLCGYYAFGEYAFPRSCLELIGKGRRTDGQLSICAPSDNPLCIPFFSLVYLLESEEYLRFSGDKEYIRAYFPKFESILQVFADRLDETGLIPSYAENRLYWNFYEWAPTLEGVCGGPEPAKTDLVLNAAYALALEAMAKMSRALGKPEEALRYLERKEKCCRAIHRGFWSEEAGLYRTVAGREAYSETANAFAVLCGAATGERAEAVCERIAGNRGELVPATLSMRGFKYDALLSADPAKYRDFILGEIDRDYGSMLEAGATSFWETMEGEAAFHRAGSLCHGWSAIPIIYHHLLLP